MSVLGTSLNQVGESGRVVPEAPDNALVERTAALWAERGHAEELHGAYLRVEELKRELEQVKQQLGEEQDRRIALEAKLRQANEQRLALDAQCHRGVAEREVAQLRGQGYLEDLASCLARVRELEAARANLEGAIAYARHKLTDLQLKNDQLTEDIRRISEVARRYFEEARVAQGDLEDAQQQRNQAQLCNQRLVGSLNGRLEELLAEWEKFRLEEDRSLTRPTKETAIEDLKWRFGPGKKFVSGYFGDLLSGIWPGAAATIARKLRMDGQRIVQIETEIATVCRTLGREPPVLRPLEAKKTYLLLPRN